MVHEQKNLENVVLVRLMRLNAMIHGLVVGTLAGLVLFVVTNWLVLKGGPIGDEGYPIIGPNLSLLNQFFIGYEVTFIGSLIGFAYAFIVGFSVGYIFATVYNWLVHSKDKRNQFA